jgi:signal transduction histidine kinase
MLAYISKYTNYIVNFGITKDLSSENILRFKLVNLITLISAICDFIFIFIAKYYLGLHLFAVALCITLILMGISLLLMKNKNYNLGRLLALLASVFGGLSAQYYVGPELRVDVLAFIQIIYVCTFFSLEEKKLIGLGSVMTLFFLTVTYGIQFELIPYQKAELNLYLLSSYNFISSLTIISLVSFFILVIKKEYYKARSEIVQLNEDLKKNLVIKNTLNKVVVHDLATPLMLIRGLSDRLLTRNETDNHKEINIINKAALNIENILKSVKVMVVDVKSVNKTKESLSMGELLNETLSSLGPIANLKNIDIVQEINTEHFINTNKAILQNNILVNLLTNAIKFSVVNSSILIKSVENDGIVSLHILDSGPGLSTEQMKSIYDFELNHSTTGSEGEKGTGYGLPIVKFSVDLLGASIEARNRLDGQTGLEMILTFKC